MCNIKIRMEKNVEKEEPKINIHQIIWYIIIFSIIGLIIETVFCYVTTGVIESRKGLIWGTFCPVYGVGATILIILLERYKDSYAKLFVYGSIIGNIIEYVLSYILEAMYGTRFWDYAFINWNLNGRICIKYSIFWGILAVLLIKIVQPIINKPINKIPNKQRRIIDVTIVTLFLVDALATIWAVNTYQNRVVSEYYDMKQEQKEENIILNTKKKIEDTLFSNEIMLKTFPNLRYIDNNGKEYYIRDIIKAN